MNSHSNTNQYLLFEEEYSTKDYLFVSKEKNKIGSISRLALPQKENIFFIQKKENCTYTLIHKESGLQFEAELTKYKNSYKIKNNLLFPKFEYEKSLTEVQLLPQHATEKSLRPAQIGAIHSLLSHWSLENGVATVVLPTGTGKTETMLLTSIVTQAIKTLVIVPTIDLKEQIFEKFQNWGMLRELGVIPYNFKNPKIIALEKTITTDEDIDVINSAEVVITTPALLARSPIKLHNKLQKLFSNVYFDEAHHVKAREWDLLKKLFKTSKIVQFTATPYRHDRQPIEGKVVFNYPLSQALKDKCFSKISLIAVDERHPKKKDLAIAQAAVQKLIADRKQGWKNHRIMVRANRLEKATELLALYQSCFPDERITLVHSDSPQRKRIIEDIKRDMYDIVICVDMLKEGFDYPNFKIAAVHGMHKSISVLLQFIGRFTRTQEGLGDASFIVNYAEENMSLELENLFQEGTGWEHVISQIADARKAQAESLLSFLQGCQPYASFDSPDITLNPKLVYPALSCVCFHADKVDWLKFKDAFNINRYAISQPYFNQLENVFYFTTQSRDKVKWARSDKIRDQTWGLIVLHYDISTKLLYLGYSDKLLDIENLIKKISLDTAVQIKDDNVFKAFHNIKRLSIVHAGIFKPANHLHRYSRLSGADVTAELSKWKEGNRCKKSDFVGIGFKEGKPISIGASIKGKVWSPSKAADLKEWKEWCINIGKVITDPNIDANQILEDSAEKIQLEEYPDNMVVLGTDWAEDLYEKIHKLTLEVDGISYLLSEAKINFINFTTQTAHFKISIYETEILFSLTLGGEKGFQIERLEDKKIYISGIKKDEILLKKFLEDYPPTLFLINSDTIAGCIHTKFSDKPEYRIPKERMEALEWNDVNFKIESIYKDGGMRTNSIQEFMMKKFISDGANIVFNDDNSGEAADIIAIFKEENLIRFELAHCKYSKEKAGARLSDLYEVCGQAIISLRYKWRPEELIRHLLRRNQTGVLAGKRFYYGEQDELNEINKALKYTNVEFVFSIAQPGVNISLITTDMYDFLSSIYSTVIDMTETKLKCYFNK
ncbi:DEAD/DEAH box helicase family protein [Acinetobacter junii]|uniref:DEAD/DEAH box helicase n=1 Tax=Acinetobacter junii TaxID=40215 RepID=UPI0032132024